MKDLWRPNLYDYIKVVAFVLMVIDHIGFFIFPDIIILRVLGRWAFPLFLFLVGFWGRHQFSSKLFYGALLIDFLWFFSWFFGYIHVFSFNILSSIVLVRFLLFYIKSFVSPLFFTVILLVVYFFNDFFSLFIDYGLMSIAFAFLWWYAYKYSFGKKIFDSLLLLFFCFCIFVFHLLWQIKIFSFSNYETFFVTSIFFIEIVVLLFLSYKNYSFSWSLIDRPILFVSRYAFELYFFHFIVLLCVFWILR
jgi:hypothetical protein